MQHTVPGSQNILGSYQGSPTDMTGAISYQRDHPGIFIFLKKYKLMFSRFIFVSSLTEASEPPRILRAGPVVFLPQLHSEEYHISVEEGTHLERIRTKME